MADGVLIPASFGVTKDCRLEASGCPPLVGSNVKLRLSFAAHEGSILAAVQHKAPTKPLGFNELGCLK